jgi:hypothetical protein
MFLTHIGPNHDSKQYQREQILREACAIPENLIFIHEAQNLPNTNLAPL